jgi:hypothetical protein
MPELGGGQGWARTADLPFSGWVRAVGMQAASGGMSDVVPADPNRCGTVATAAVPSILSEVSGTLRSRALHLLALAFALSSRLRERRKNESIARPR